LATALAEVAVRSEPARTTTQILAAMRMTKGKGEQGSYSMTKCQLCRVLI
jgi:hypothetical protein